MSFVYQYLHCWRFLVGYPFSARCVKAWKMARYLRQPEEELGEYWP